MMIDDELYTDLTPEKIDEILQKFQISNDKYQLVSSGGEEEGS
jgi:hypothetical protein